MIENLAVVVVMPAYNAAETLRRTYDALPHGIVDQVVLVDDQSRDATAALARELGLVVHVHERNRGYGGNQKTCYRLALELGADIVVMAHPDYQYTPRLVGAMASMIASGHYDLVLGSRILGGRTLRSGMPLYKYVANRFLTMAENLLLGGPFERVSHRFARLFAAPARGPAPRAQLRGFRLRQRNPRPGAFFRIRDRRDQLPDTLFRRSLEHRLLPSRDERWAGYQEEYYEPQAGARFLAPLEWAVAAFRLLRTRVILRHEPGPTSLLDVGCGRGALLEIFKRRGWRVLGTQLSRTAARAAREKRGVEVLTGELPELEIAPGSFRVVTLYHVLEHLDRPSLYLRRTWEILEENGLLIVEVTNYQSPGFRFLGLRNLCVDHPHHLYFFTPATLGALLEQCHFEILGRAHFSLEYSPITTLQNLLNVLPGRPNRFLDALRHGVTARRLWRQPATWLHAALAALLAPAALVVSLAGIFLPVGNTICFYARKRPAALSDFVGQ